MAQRYEFYFRVVKTIFYKRAQRVSRILFLPRENKIYTFKPPCNFLVITWTSQSVFAQTTCTVQEREMTSSISSLVRIWQIPHSNSGCTGTL